MCHHKQVVEGIRKMLSEPGLPEKVSEGYWMKVTSLAFLTYFKYYLPYKLSVNTNVINRALRHDFLLIREVCTFSTAPSDVASYVSAALWSLLPVSAAGYMLRSPDWGRDASLAALVAARVARRHLWPLKQLESALDVRYVAACHSVFGGLLREDRISESTADCCADGQTLFVLSAYTTDCSVLGFAGEARGIDQLAFLLNTAYCLLGVKGPPPAPNLDRSKPWVLKALTQHLHVLPTKSEGVDKASFSCSSVHTPTPESEPVEKVGSTATTHRSI